MSAAQIDPITVTRDAWRDDLGRPGVMLVVDCPVAKIVVAVPGGDGVARRAELATRQARARLIEMIKEQVKIETGVDFSEADVLMAMREVIYLSGHAHDDVAFKRQSLAGPCFCADMFQCTRCQLREDAS